jgi:hypothetical protein
MRADWFPARGEMLRFGHDVTERGRIERIETFPPHLGERRVATTARRSPA